MAPKNLCGHSTHSKGLISMWKSIYVVAFCDSVDMVYVLTSLYPMVVGIHFLCLNLCSIDEWVVSRSTYKTVSYCENWMKTFHNFNVCSLHL